MKETELSSNTKTADGKWQFVFHNHNSFGITAEITVPAYPSQTISIPAKGDFPFNSASPNIRGVFTDANGAVLTPRYCNNGEVIFDTHGKDTV